MKSINYLLLFIICTLSVSCAKTNSEQSNSNELTQKQVQLKDEGWIFVQHKGGEMESKYGVKSKYGIQDNYFDISVGSGYDVVVKIVDINTDQCIRYIYVPQNQTITTNEIPQGRYYLKLSYGKDWMEKEADGITLGKFTRSVIYEKSSSAYDFGKKNSSELVDHILKLNVIDGSVENNFRTEEISEEEFMQN